MAREQRRVHSPSGGEESQEETGRHHRQVDEQGEGQPEELSEVELVAREGLREQGVERPPLDLLAHEAHADEERDGDAEEVHRRKADVFEDLLVLPDREVAQEEPGEGHQDGEHHEVVQDALPHGLAEGVGGHREESLQSSALHSSPPAAAPSSLKK